MSDGTRVGIGKVAAEGTSVVVSRLQSVVDLRRCSVTIVHSGFILIAGENLLPVTIGIEVGAMLGVAVSESGCGEALAIVVDDH